MGSFVGVPVRIGEEVFGNLYLTERIAGGASRATCTTRSSVNCSPSA